MKETFSDIERENEFFAPGSRGASKSSKSTLGLIDPSPFADRFNQEDDPTFEALKQSIAERGQEIPILLRVHAPRPADIRQPLAIVVSERRACSGGQ